MHKNHPLAPQLEILLSLKSRRDAAASAHEAYVQHRSWWAWLRDAVSSPASASSKLAADKAFIAMEHRLRSDLGKWVAEATVHGIHAEPSVSVRQRELLERRSDVAARQARLNDLLTEANKVCRLLETAISDCEAASTSEVFDMLSSSKAIALMSSMHSGDAKDSVQAAQAGLRKFVESWPKRGTGLDVPEINDTLDFVLDMVGVDFDFMSFLNMQALDDAADACKAALKKFKQQIQPVDKANDKLRGLIAQLNSELLRLRQPFFHRVLDGLPPPLKAYAPSSLSL